MRAHVFDKKSRKQQMQLNIYAFIFWSRHRFLNAFYKKLVHDNYKAYLNTKNHSENHSKSRFANFFTQKNRNRSNTNNNKTYLSFHTFWVSLVKSIMETI